MNQNMIISDVLKFECQNRVADKKLSLAKIFECGAMK